MTVHGSLEVAWQDVRLVEEREFKVIVFAAIIGFAPLISIDLFMLGLRLWIVKIPAD